MASKQLSWRVQSNDAGGFDEIVVGSGDKMILHAEMMTDKSCFVDVAGICLWVYIDRKGVAKISMQEDQREDRKKRKTKQITTSKKSK